MLNNAFSICRLRAAVHYTVACLCEEVAEDKEIHFSKQAIAAISEITFRQCDTFAQDLERFAKHAKRITIKPEDVKLLSRRSNSLLKYITQKSEELTLKKTEEKAKKKKTSSRTSDEHVGPAAADSEDSNMA
ncbi:PREDICTED: centromere protein S-like [Gekko japonicus]|uniref:Centromere protein S n=1 Tax=Gekko japonicus TaxID=146911 RepID=A0ABM1LBH0_GEKJA|nr:PREDICTED: centromere protein S-like [Gekko japonicus]